MINSNVQNFMQQSGNAQISCTEHIFYSKMEIPDIREYNPGFYVKIQDFFFTKVREIFLSETNLSTSTSNTCLIVEKLKKKI